MDNFDKWLAKLWQTNGSTKVKDIKYLLHSLDFEKKFKIINVVGTNGKGSVTKYLTDNLIKAGYKVGTFTSPHITSFNERIKVNNYKITDKQFYDIVNPILPLLNKFGIMWFGILYIAAMLHFASKDVDYVVLEAGIGGTHDATNAINGDYGAVTSISEDHLDIFGSRENIAKDKAGIINSKMIFFLPTLSKADQKPFYDKKMTKSFTLVKVKTDDLDTYVERNERLAHEMLEFILPAEEFVFKRPEGRAEVKGNIIMDVAHNQEGIEETLKFLKASNIDFDQVVLSLSKDKDVSIDFDKPVFLYKNKGRKPMEIKDYKVQGQEIKNLKSFIKTNEDKKTLFIGSFFLISEVKDLINDSK